MLATLGFGLGHVAPFWLRQDAVPALNVPALGIGLWYQCPEVGGCFNYDFATDPGKAAVVVVAGGWVWGGVRQVVGWWTCVSVRAVCVLRGWGGGGWGVVAVCVVLVWWW